MKGLTIARSILVALCVVTALFGAVALSAQDTAVEYGDDDGFDWGWLGLLGLLGLMPRRPVVETHSTNPNLPPRR